MTSDKKKAYMRRYCEENREKRKRYAKEYRRKNREKIKAYRKGYNDSFRGFTKRLWLCYNITPEQHQQLYVDQNGCCALCDESVAYDKICVDHNHKTGKIRGLLCHRCNHGLGCLGDNIEGLRRAVKYLNIS